MLGDPFEVENPATARRRRGLWLVALLMAVAMIGAIASSPSPRTSGPRPGLRVDLNTAPRGVIEALPRIGPALAARIIEARDEAAFSGPGDLDRRVKGIGPATLESVRPFLRSGND